MIEIYKLFKSLYMKTYQKQNIKSEKKKKSGTRITEGNNLNKVFL